MRADQHLAAGGGPERAATEATVPGRVDVKERVYRTVTEQASATPVSYTHLTLPTKRIV